MSQLCRVRRLPVVDGKEGIVFPQPMQTEAVSPFAGNAYGRGHLCHVTGTSARVIGTHAGVFT